MRWFSDGDMNSKFFHSYVNGRRKKLHLSEITTEHGEILNTSQQIGKEANKFFTKQFKQEQQDQDFTMLHHIPKMITDEQNEKITRVPSAEEVKYVVF